MLPASKQRWTPDLLSHMIISQPPCRGHMHRKAPHVPRRDKATSLPASCFPPTKRALHKAPSVCHVLLCSSNYKINQTPSSSTTHQHFPKQLWISKNISLWELLKKKKKPEKKWLKDAVGFCFDSQSCIENDPKCRKSFRWKASH